MLPASHANGAPELDEELDELELLELDEELEELELELDELALELACPDELDVLEDPDALVWVSAPQAAKILHSNNSIIFIKIPLGIVQTLKNQPQYAASLTLIMEQTQVMLGRRPA